MDVLRAIGNTSMARLRKVVPLHCADILVKLEWENPTGSVKDRMAQIMISRAEEDGRLKPGDTVVEYTGGSTGASLALVCAAKGYRLRIVTSDAFSHEKLDHMAALGAELTLVRSEGGLTTKKLILDMIEAARELSQEPRTYWTDQLNNHDSIAGYYSLGEEIWSQTKGKIDAFVHCVGTAASSRGVATVLKRYKPSIKIVVVEPAESSVLLGGLAGPRQNCFAFSGAREIVRSPRSEAEMTDNFLISHGFQVPKVWLVSRFVTLGAADRKSEMIVFYMEGSDELTLQDLYDGEEPTKKWEVLKPEITARARNAFGIDD